MIIFPFFLSLFKFKIEFIEFLSEINKIEKNDNR